MINHKGSFYLGVFVFIIPFLGFPTMWKMGLVVFSGVLLILMSVKIPSPRKAFKAKPKREGVSESVSPVIAEAPSVNVMPTPAPINVPVIKIESSPRISTPIKKVRSVAQVPPKINKGSRMDSVRRPNVNQQ